MLSITSQYAIRALVILAEYPCETSVLGRDLARDGKIPRNYLAKILLALKNAGILGTARGSQGGYWLIKAPDSLKLVDVVRIFDHISDPPPCLLGKHELCYEDGPVQRACELAPDQRLVSGVSATDDIGRCGGRSENRGETYDGDTESLCSIRVRGTQHLVRAWLHGNHDSM